LRCARIEQEPTRQKGYERFLTVTWGYADEGSGELPDAATGSEMERFEGHLCDAFEHDALAVLAAVLTFDGARQWVFYTHDVQECANRLSVIPDYHGEPYPIELTSEEDPTWAYLREQILGRVPTDG
jgi:hypothetical protein